MTLEIDLDENELLTLYGVIIGLLSVKRGKSEKYIKVLEGIKLKLDYHIKGYKTNPSSSP